MKFPAASVLLILWWCLCSPSQQTISADEIPSGRPNILWITSEDNAAHWLGCYGNDQANTPRLDALARESILFQNAFSNAPVCAVARSTILTGCYAPTIGTQHMRSRYRIPSKFKPYVSYLREHGYYCTNRSKTDYNIAGNDKALWDECSGKAHYKNRGDGQPFFAIFNLTVSHESSLFPARVHKNRKNGVIPQQTRLDPDQVIVPPFLPDLPEVRSDIAIYQDNMTALDQRIGKLLDELDEAGLADDTVVFYYSDHGGPTPRGKRYLHDTGVRVPLLIRVPEKYRELSPFANGEQTDELVSFVDFAPTLISLCGLEKPVQMQGRPFLGEQRVQPADDATVFLYADRFDGTVGMRRGIRDRQFKYIRRFTPHLPAAPYSQYSLGVPSWKAWQQAWHHQTLREPFQRIWDAPQSVEMLFDTEADPWEIKNLAEDPAFAERLQAMRSRLKESMVANFDSGVVPEPLFDYLVGDGTTCDYLQGDKVNVRQWVDLAWQTTDVTPQDLPKLIESISNDDPVVRYWALLGCLVLGDQAASHASDIRKTLDDSCVAIRIASAQALIAAGETDGGKSALIAEFQPPYNKPEGTLYQLINAAQFAKIENDIPQAWASHYLDFKQVDKHIRSFAARLINERHRP